MRLRYKYIVILGILTAGLVSCRQDEPEQLIRLEINLCLPADGLTESRPFRVIGDPGAREDFRLPRYVYLFVTKNDGLTDKVWRKEIRTLDAGQWEYTRYIGQRMNRMDSVFKYTQPIQYLLNNERPQGKVFAICSNKKLTFTPSFESINSSMSETDLLNLKFSTAPDSIQGSLQDIYATPYNYSIAGTYYCTYDCSSGKSFAVDLLLYHIAAKVDIKWSVADEKRINKNNPSEAVRLTYMQAQNLFNGNAYCFKPMRNEAASKVSSDISVNITNNDEGLWWEGRSYFYTIPYTVTGEPNYFPLQMVMRTNNSEGTGYRPTIKLTIDTSSVFVPWLRANFNLTQPLTDGEDTKVI